MTELLRRAVAEIEKLPASEQDAIASRILAELAEEQTWSERFAGTTDEQWDRIAEMARRDIAAGGAISLGDFLSTRTVEEHEQASGDGDGSDTSVQHVVLPQG